MKKQRLPELPSNIDKRRRIKDIRGNTRHMLILDEVSQIQSTHPEKAIYLQLLRFEDTAQEEIRIGYYVIGKKGKMNGKWVWGQYATMMPSTDLAAILRKAAKKQIFRLKAHRH